MADCIWSPGSMVGCCWKCVGSVDYVSQTNAARREAFAMICWSPLAGDTIQFASNLAGKAITLGDALPNITKPLTITGLGASQLTINGGGAYTVFDVASNVTAAISGMTITNGYSTYGDGGGIHNDGNLTISGCKISYNQTLMGEGGGIYNSLNLTVSNCTISNISCVTGGPSGGGIYFDGSYGGSSTVSNCVSGNVSESGGAITTTATETRSVRLRSALGVFRKIDGLRVRRRHHRWQRAGKRLQLVHSLLPITRV